MPTIKIVPFPGAPGPRGEQGPRGYQGDTGLTGPAGDSAYDVAVANGFEGTEQEWVESLNLVHVVAAQAGLTDQEWLETRASVSEETEYSMSGGTLGTQPTFSGDPLFDASYIANGSLVYFRINVGFSNITSFGNGQYYVTLPFNSKYDIFLREGHIYDASTQSSYGISAHVEAGTNQMKLSYTSSNGLDEPFTYNTPILLTTSDHFHISGTFIKETA